MARRRGNVTRPDPNLEAAAGTHHLALVENRRMGEKNRLSRNQDWFLMFHANGYTQRRIAEITNERAGLGPDDPDYVTDDTVEKALRRQAS